MFTVRFGFGFPLTSLWCHLLRSGKTGWWCSDQWILNAWVSAIRMRSFQECEIWYLSNFPYKPKLMLNCNKEFFKTFIWAKRSCTPGTSDSGSNLHWVPPRQRGGYLLQQKFPPRFFTRSFLCKWGVQIHTVLSGWCIYTNKDTICVVLREVLVRWSKEEGQNSLRIVDSDGVNEQGVVWEAKSSVCCSSQYAKYVRSLCQANGH